MRLMLGMIRPDAGEVRIDGMPLSAMDGRVWAGVGHLVEQALAYGELDVRSNLRISARLHGASPAEAAAMAESETAELDHTRYARVRAAGCRSETRNGGVSQQLCSTTRTSSCWMSRPTRSTRPV